MRQTILIAAALMLVLSAALFAVAPVHAAGASTCPGYYGGVGGAGAGGVSSIATNGGPLNPLVNGGVCDSSFQAYNGLAYP